MPIPTHRNASELFCSGSLRWVHHHSTTTTTTKAGITMANEDYRVVASGDCETVLDAIGEAFANATPEALARLGDHLRAVADDPEAGARLAEGLGWA